MNTQNIPDDELDDFFKKSLAEPEINFREEDWLHLEKKLNTAVQQKQSSRRFLYSLIALLLLSVGLISWLLVNFASENATGISTQIKPDKEVITQTPQQIFVQPSNKIITPSTSKHDKLIGESKKQATFPESATKNKVTQSDKLKSIEDPSITTQEKELTTSTKPHEDKITNESGKTVVLTPNPSRHVKDKLTLKQIEENSRPSVDEKIVSEKPSPVKTKEPRDRKETPDTEITETNDLADQNSNGDKPGKKSFTPAGNNSLVINSGARQITSNTETASKTEKTPGSNAESSFISEEKSGMESNDAALPETLMEVEASNQNVTLLSPLSLLKIKTSGEEYNLQEKYTDILEKKIAENALAVHALQKDSAQRKLLKERLVSRFSLNLLLSPDLSSVGFSHRAAPGTNTGITLEYHFSNAWSISTGAIYSTKIYGADAKDYTPKPGFWTYYVWPVEVKGNCKVIDIPINIRYNFLRREKSNVYATMGLSSYLMLKEDYKYIYDVDDTYLRKSWQTSNENKHFFKVYNVSLGYERRLSHKFSLQAEPFLKLPLAGVGYGKIKLLTTGAFVSLKYRL